MFNFQQFYVWAQLLGLDITYSEQKEVLTEFYKQLTTIIVPETTGMLLSPQFGWDVLHSKPASSGVIFAVDQHSDDQDPRAFPILSKLWTVEHIRNNYGVAKLKLQYHPDEELSAQKRKLVAELYEYAQYEKVDFILELVTSTNSVENENDEESQSVQLQAIKHFRQLCDAMILEMPSDAFTAATVTAELDIPWILTDAGFTGYTEHKEAIRLCLESGAKGCVVGSSLLSDHELPLPLTQETMENMVRELATTVRDRALELRRITEEHQMV